MHGRSNIKIFRGVKEYLGKRTPLLDFVITEAEETAQNRNYLKSFTSLRHDKSLYNNSLVTGYITVLLNLLLFFK